MAALFIGAGVLTIAIALLSLKTLPESPRFLAGRRHRWDELRALLARLGHVVPADTPFVEPSTESALASRASIASLFTPVLRRDTLGLMGAFTCCLLAIYTGFLWIPAMLTDPAVGFSQPSASYALSLFNVGGVAGALAGAVVIQRLGSRIAMLGLSALAVASALAMAGMPLNAAAPFATMAMFTISGALLNAVQTTMFALAAHVFPTTIRGTGVGTTMAVGLYGERDGVLCRIVGAFRRRPVVLLFDLGSRDGHRVRVARPHPPPHSA